MKQAVKYLTTALGVCWKRGNESGTMQGAVAKPMVGASRCCMALIAYVSLVPVYLLGNLVLIAVAVGIAASLRNRRLGIALAATVVVPSAVYWAVFPFVTGVQRQMAFDMEWSYGEKWESYPDADYVVLRFRSYPNHYVGIVSKDLGRYLETLPSQDVRVVFDVTLDFGRTRGFTQVQVGELRSWNSLDGCTGVNGDSEPSPWP